MPTGMLLDAGEILRVMTDTCICYMACVSEGMPYVLPLGFRLTGDGVLLHIRRSGKLYATLEASPQVCMAFSLIGGSHVDSVLAEGEARLCPTQDEPLAAVLVRIRSASGRRYPLSRMV